MNWKRLLCKVFGHKEITTEGWHLMSIKCARCLAMDVIQIRDWSERP